ncbi:hypothetical protein FJZ28_01750 [Candidatus Peregrinibacteria bacterium]|nr:hypothetical protein [Candidatus Peregrinibacteria bacterium]
MSEAPQSNAGETKVPPKLPDIPSGDKLFATIMGPIEPDLVLTTEERNAKYTNETPVETAARIERYGKAIATYRKQYADFVNKQTGDIRVFGNALLHDFEGDDQSGANALSEIESQISNMQ